MICIKYVYYIKIYNIKNILIYYTNNYTSRRLQFIAIEIKKN